MKNIGSSSVWNCREETLIVFRLGSIVTACFHTQYLPDWSGMTSLQLDLYPYMYVLDFFLSFSINTPVQTKTFFF